MPEDSLKESGVPCNCRWMNCPNHEGKLCTNNAAYTDCDNGGEEHWLGDKALGEDVHICTECGYFVAALLTTTLPKIMQRMSEYTPAWLKPLETFVRDHYIGKYIDPKTGWQYPQKDALAVLSFAAVILQFNKSAIPEKLLDDLGLMLEAVAEITAAYGSTEVNIHE